MVAEEPIFFANPGEFRAWLAENHDRARDVRVGYHRKATGKPSMTWQDSVDQALCYGWIDGIRRGIDGERYKMRFTPRRRGSFWSATNTRRARELIAEGLMQPAGLRAFEARDEAKTARYSYEQRYTATLDPELEKEFRASHVAWSHFEAQRPSYRQAAIWWIVTAKRDETKRKRLRELIEASAAGRKPRALIPPEEARRDDRRA